MSSPAYALLANNWRAPDRLRYMREYAARLSNTCKTWRDARFGKITTNYGLSPGFNGDDRHKVPVWYAMDGASLARESFAHDILKLGHTGWYTQPDGEHTRDGWGLVRGIVVALPHGRFIAGYWVGDNNERVYFPELFDDAKDAARMADEHARVMAEAEQEYQLRWRAASDLESEAEDKLSRLRECLALRNNACFTALREEAAEIIARIREIRDTLATDYAGVL